MERQKFEDSWKGAFDQAEVSPSETVWTNIELELEKAKGSTLRRRLLFFQLLAAACVIFTLGIGVGVYVVSDTTLLNNPQLAQRVTDNASHKSDATIDENNLSGQNNSDKKNATTRETTPALNESSTLNHAAGDQDNTGNTVSESITRDQSPSIAEAQKRATTDPGNHQQNNGFTLRSIPASSMNTALVDDNNDQQLHGVDNHTLAAAILSNDRATLAAKDLQRPSLVEKRQAIIPAVAAGKEETVEVDPIASMLAKLEQREKEMAKEEKEEDKHNAYENLWTSVGFAAGTFNSVNPGVGGSTRTMAMTQNTNVASQEVKASGVSYSVGANIGKKISNRWVLQGGVNYLTQSSDYTTENAVGSADYTNFQPASIHALEQLNSAGNADASSKLIITSPYTVNNSLRYLSIPLQAGYLLVNRDFGVQLNAGVATDVFLQNSVTAHGQNVSGTTQGLGEDTPYRSVNMSGLMGTEFSYKFAQKYRISLNPGLRYPFSSIYRSELAIKATPLTFDIGVRFRYIFK